MRTGNDRRVSVAMPACIGNFGPGFDAISLAVADQGDTVELRLADEDRIALRGPGAEGIPTEWSRNTAGRALDALRAKADVDDRYELTITKRQPPGSGLGSSASSAAGAALAFHRLHPERRLTAADLVEAAADGDNGDRHYDDVAACLLGGLALVRLGPDGHLRLGRVTPPENLHLALVRPDLVLETRDMRRLLPDKIPLADAVANLENLAHLLHAFETGEIRMMAAAFEDRVATPYRRVKMPYFEAVVRAGKEAGAYGVAVSGSGPTMVGITDSEAMAQSAAAAMQMAVESTGLSAKGFAARPEQRRIFDEV